MRVKSSVCTLMMIFSTGVISDSPVTESTYQVNGDALPLDNKWPISL